MALYNGQAQTPDYGDALRLIDRWISAERDYNRLPSVSVAIVKDQEVLWSKAYGLASIESGQDCRDHYVLQYLQHHKVIYLDCHHAAIRSR